MAVLMGTVKQIDNEGKLWEHESHSLSAAELVLTRRQIIAGK